MKVFFVIFLFLASAVQAEEFGPAYDADVSLFVGRLMGDDGGEAEEMLVRLRWAGITDPRIFDKVQAPLNALARLSKKKQAVYVKALALSGNEKYLPSVHYLADFRSNIPARSTARKYLRIFDKQQMIANDMANFIATQEIATNDQLWAARYKKGLETTDVERLRWAARDLFLYAESDEAMAVAIDYLRQNCTRYGGDYKIDAMAFLVKALGKRAYEEKYLQVLKEIANTTNHKKLYDYTMRQIHLFENTFQADNKYL